MIQCTFVGIASGSRGAEFLDLVGKQPPSEFTAVALVDISLDLARSEVTQLDWGAIPCFDSLSAANGAVDADTAIIPFWQWHMGSHYHVTDFYARRWVRHGESLLGAESYNGIRSNDDPFQMPGGVRVIEESPLDHPRQQGITVSHHQVDGTGHAIFGPIDVGITKAGRVEMWVPSMLQTGWGGTVRSGNGVNRAEVRFDPLTGTA